MINLFFSNGRAYVWNPDDACILRKEHHIVGSLVGCYPTKPFQIHTKWLPLQLMPEETTLLLEKGIAKLIPSPLGVPERSVVHSYYERKEKLCEEQLVLLKENRRKEIVEKADEIYEGKKRKLLEGLGQKNKKRKAKTENISNSSQYIENNPDTSENKDIEEADSNSAGQELKTVDDLEIEKRTESTINSSTSCSETQLLSIDTDGNIDAAIIDKKAVIEAELAKVPEVKKELCMTQLFTECPWKNIVIESIRWKYPSSDIENLRYSVFRDLWEKEYYITGGSKFGGDFLAYEGDPLKYHALYIVICITSTTEFQATDIVIYGRLGHQVKKTVVLASLDEAGKVVYISLNWASEIACVDFTKYAATPKYIVSSR